MSLPEPVNPEGGKFFIESLAVGPILLGFGALLYIFGHGERQRDEGLIAHGKTTMKVGIFATVLFWGFNGFVIFHALK